MKRLIAALVLVVVWSSPSSAQQRSGDLSSTTCPGTGCLTIGVGGLGSAAIQLTGTWAGTITFEGSIDGATFTTVNMTPITGDQTAVTTTTSNGIWGTGVGGLVIFRARMSAYTSGTARVTLSASEPLVVAGQAGAGGGGGGGGSGTVTSIETTSPITGGEITTTGTIACPTCGVTGSTLAQFAATTSAQLAGVISDETGTGALVFAGSPTFTGIPVLAAPTSTTFASGVTAPEANATWQLKSAGAATAAGNDWDSRFIITDTTCNKTGLAVLATGFSTEVYRGMNIYHCSNGLGALTNDEENIAIYFAAADDFMSLWASVVQVTGGPLRICCSGGTNYALQILSTDFSTDVTDGVRVWQDDNGEGNISVAGGTSGDPGVLTRLLPSGTITIEPNLTVNGAGGVRIQNTYVNTAIEPPNGWFTLISETTYGAGGVAAQGNAHAIAGYLFIEGSGDANNEFAAWHGGINMKIGTGFTQTAAPTGDIWYGDLGIIGPIAVQPGRFAGLVMYASNYYNGSPSKSPSGGHFIVTVPNGGPGNDATHLAANTYPIDIGLGISGKSVAGGTDGVGFTTAIAIGGNISPWEEGNSLIGTGISISDVTTTLINAKATEATDATIVLASDEGDDTADTWTLNIAASGNAFTFINSSAIRASISTAGRFDAQSFGIQGGSAGATGTSCTQFTSGLCTAASAPESSPLEVALATARVQVAALEARVSALEAALRVGAQR